MDDHFEPAGCATVRVTGGDDFRNVPASPEDRYLRLRVRRDFDTFGNEA